MKNIQSQRRQTILSFSVLIILLMGCGKKADSSGPINTFKRYPMQKFHLTYEYSGDFRGTEDMYVSDYGKYEATYLKFDVFTPQLIQHKDNGSITRIAEMYGFDMVEKTISHNHNAFLDSLYHLDENDIPTPLHYQESEMKDHLYRKVGVEIIDGKPVTKWEVSDAGMTVWIWNNLIIRKHVLSKTGVLEVNIKNIDSLWTVDTTMFSIPLGLTAKENEARAN